LIFWPPK